MMESLKVFVKTRGGYISGPEVRVYFQGLQERGKIK